LNNLDKNGQFDSSQNNNEQIDKNTTLSLFNLFKTQPLNSLTALREGISNWLFQQFAHQNQNEQKNPENPENPKNTQNNSQKSHSNSMSDSETSRPLKC